MSEFIEFTRNYSDLSTQRGFQWEFFCQRCGNGYRSEFQASATGLVTEAMETAGGLLGGIFGNIANVSGRIHSAAWQQAHDNAFKNAADEVKELFVQCPHCNSWVCRNRCWNEARGMCLNCAPDAAVEAAQAQSQAVVDQARQKVAERQYDVEQYTQGDDRRAGCPNCGASLKPNAKFCGECGTAIKAQKFCTECGAQLEGNTKFCPDCGAKQ